MITPKEIVRFQEPAALKIIWSDQQTSLLTGLVLRKNCPCAECKEKRGEINHQNPLTKPRKALSIVQSDLKDASSITKVWLIGNYAIGVQYADGHSAGVYKFDYLRDLCSEK